MLSIKPRLRLVLTKVVDEENEWDPEVPFRGNLKEGKTQLTLCRRDRDLDQGPGFTRVSKAGKTPRWPTSNPWEGLMAIARHTQFSAEVVGNGETFVAFSCGDTRRLWDLVLA